MYIYIYIIYNFDVTMGSYEGSEVCELSGSLRYFPVCCGC